MLLKLGVGLLLPIDEEDCGDKGSALACSRGTGCCCCCACCCGCWEEEEDWAAAAAAAAAAAC